MVYWEKLGSHPATILFKYVGQAIMTFRILLREKPRAVFVMTPPVIAILPVFLYSKLRKIPYIIDAHSGAFLNLRWRHLQWLQHALSRSASTTIVTNGFLAERLRSRNAHATVIRDVPVRFAPRAAPADGRDFTIAVVCSFNYDEPIKEIIEAARQLPGVRFFVTGNPKHLDPTFAREFPTNVSLTGFLPVDQYGALLAEAHAVLTLTTLDHTMLRGAYEAIYQSTPVIISDSQILRDAFPEGAIHVPNTAPTIRQAIETMRREYERHKTGAVRLRQQKLRAWESAKCELLARAGALIGSK